MYNDWHHSLHCFCPFKYHGFCSCPFLKNLKNPTQMLNCKDNPTQKQALLRPLTPSTAKFGNSDPGPLGCSAEARARMLPSTCTPTMTKAICSLVSVCVSIIPNPTPWMASRTPSQSHSVRQTNAPLNGDPAQGSQHPMLEVLQRICPHRGAPGPTADMGSIHECRLDRPPKRASIKAHTLMKKTSTSIATTQDGACWPDQRYLQLWLTGRARKKFWIDNMTKNHWVMSDHSV